MTVRRRAAGNTFETTISILDFVTICLGATLLLVVMVPNQSRSQAVIAAQQEALQLVRMFFAKDTLNNNVHLSEDLVARHPSLLKLKSRAPHEFQGKRLSALDESQRVRRSEILIEVTGGVASIAGRLEATLATLRDRGIGYLNIRAFSQGGTGSATDSLSSMVLAASDTGLSIVNSLSSLTTTSAYGALQAAENSRHQSATPTEPIVVVVETTAGLEAIAASLSASACPADAADSQAGLLIVGPPIDSSNASAAQTSLGACARSDYVVTH